MMAKRMEMRQSIDANKQKLMEKMEKVKQGKLDIGSVYESFGKSIINKCLIVRRDGRQ